MTVTCSLSAAEMREAFRLNLTPGFWWKAALGNSRALIYVIVLIALIATRGRGADWHQVALLVGLVAFFFAMYSLRLHRNLSRQAKALNESCKAITVDGQGVTAEASNGSKTSIPWSAIHRWREGKLVFTFGDAKAFRTIPKSALGELQTAELRSLLQSQIQIR
jgi:hypothetical protein